MKAPESLPLKRLTYIAVLLALLIYGLVAMRMLLQPLAWALFLALLMLPMVNWLERRRWPPVVAIFTVIVLVTVVLAALMYFLSAQMIGLVSDIPKLSDKLGTYLDQLRQWGDQSLGIPYETQPEQLRSRLGSLTEQAVGVAGNALSSTARVASFLGLLPIYIFLLLLYRHHLKAFLSRLTHTTRILETATKATHVVRRYLQGLVIVTLITGVLATLVFVTLGVKYALFFGLFVAIFNLIPYVGVFIASTVSVVYVFLTSDSLTYPILALTLLWGIQLIENNLITPYVVGNRIRLNALAVLISIVAGGLMWGVSGLILFIPLLGAIKVLFDEVDSLKPWGFLMGEPKDERKRDAREAKEQPKPATQPEEEEKS